MRQLPYSGPGHITRYCTKFRLVAMATCLPRLCTPGPHLACFSFVRMSSGRTMIQAFGLQRYREGRSLIRVQVTWVLWWT
jgi:hypothetical protein